MRNIQQFRILSVLLLSLTILILLAGCSAEDPSSIYPGKKEPDQEKLYSITLPNPEPGGERIYQTVLEEFSISNNYGEEIFGYIRRPDPDQYPGLIFAAVVKVPGGINPGRSEALALEAVMLAEAGMVVVTFNAEGRVDERNQDDLRSEGGENFNGHQNQDTLARIIDYVQKLPYVDPGNIGVRTQSYGITMAAGCAARYPDLPIKYIIDGEGPPSSFVTVQEPWAMFSSEDHPNHEKYQIVYQILGHYSVQRDPSSENIAFWEEREAIRFIGEYKGMYLRLQGEWDHSQPPSQPTEIYSFHQPPIWWQGKHACDMVNAALDGGVPWVRVNLPGQGNPVNQRCNAENPPVFISGEVNNNPLVPVLAVIEMARAESIPENR